MSTKELIKELKPKKMKVDDIVSLLEFDQKEFVEFYVKEAHKPKNADVIKDLYVKMNNMKFAKALKKLAKSDVGLDIGFTVIIAGFIENLHSSIQAANKGKSDDEKIEMDAELIEVYSNIIDKLLKKRIKEVNKKLNLDPSVIKDLLIVVPEVDGYISDDRFVGIYSQKMLRKLYYTSAKNEIGLENTKQIKKLFTRLFGEDLVDLIAINILLEKKEFVKNFNEKQVSLWNLMTDFALEVVESQEKKHVIELLEYYCRRRKADDSKQRDGARRINLNEVDTDKYSRIVKCLKKFKKDGKEAITKFI